MVKMYKKGSNIVVAFPGGLVLPFTGWEIKEVFDFLHFALNQD